MEAQYPPAPLEERFLDVPYDQRWECLKQAIVGLFLGAEGRPGLKFKEIARVMKEAYGFTAEVHQYRYHINRKWKIKNQFTTEEKRKVASILGKDTRPGLGTANVTISQAGGSIVREVNKKKLNRYLNAKLKEHGESLRLPPGFFASWSLPPSALFATRRLADHPSPASFNRDTPPYYGITVQSPNADGASPTCTSPTTQLARTELLQRRTNLLLHGDISSLAQQLSAQELSKLGSYLHDFWMHAFVTTKYWGRGPREWTPYLIKWKTRKSLMELGDTPSSSATPTSPSGHEIQAPRPSQLCRWSIHYRCPIKYEEGDSSPKNPDVDQQFDLDDESSWPLWERSKNDTGVTEQLQSSLTENSFTTAALGELPISINSLAKATQQSPEEMETNAVAFAIMTGNFIELDNILFRVDPPLSGIDPFHLAAGFLDGSRSCCLVMNCLLGMEDENSIGALYRNSKGLTVLDYLLMKILVSHTSIHPSALSEVFREPGTFLGEDRDICGRWDCDSPCVRQHHELGNRHLPLEWKHPFCHTSVQAICHCIMIIFGPEWAPDPNRKSGLLRDVCPCCRTDLEVYPLHVLVLITFYLANNGCKGETLFGSLAVLLCLVYSGSDPSLAADAPISKFLGIEDDGSECRHPSLSPIELIAYISPQIVESWSPEAQVGWEVFVKALESATNHRRLYKESQVRRKEEEEEEEEETDSGDENEKLGIEPCCDRDKEYLLRWHYCSGRYIGALWAAVQAEFLTYRRVGERDAWISEHFDMRAILEKGPEAVPLLREGMIKEFRRCGRVESAVDNFPRHEDVCVYHFMNMDDFKRTSFVNPVSVAGWQQ